VISSPFGLIVRFFDEVSELPPGVIVARRSSVRVQLKGYCVGFIHAPLSAKLIPASSAAVITRSHETGNPVRGYETVPAISTPLQALRLLTG
jgi:hypothetical protein